MAGRKKSSFKNSILLHIFQNANIANIGDATGLRGSTVAGNLYVALYTVAPSDSGAGTECNYTGYARVATVRSAAGWTVAGNNASNAAPVTFPKCTGGSNTAVAFAVCKEGVRDVDDAIYWNDALSGGNLIIGNNVIPGFDIGELDVNEE
jgi:hypothetical protein